MTPLLQLFANGGRPATIADFIAATAFDEFFEIDMTNNRFSSIYRVEGKYYLPPMEHPHLDTYAFILDNMVHPDDKETFVQLMDPNTLSERLEASEVPGAVSAQFRYKLHDGNWRWVEQCVFGDGRMGLPKGVVHCYVIDAEAQYAMSMGRDYYKYYMPSETTDQKTGLIRESAFLSGMFPIIEERPELEWCVIAIDIDHFKLFNDWYGRDAGDILLGNYSMRLAQEALRWGGLAGYLGHDDFCLLIPHDRNTVDNLFEDLCNCSARLGAGAGFTPAFGICIIEPGMAEFDVLDRAHIAVENARADYRKNICIYKPTMKEQAEREYRILVDFLDGLENGEVYFQLQPQCRMSTGTVVGAEALARWRKADGTMVSPLDFVPALEHNGTVSTLDCYIWDAVCAWQRAWIDAGHTPVPVSVNVSQVDFYALDVPEHFQQLVEKYDLPPSLLKIEVTESAYVDNAVVVSGAIEQLREMGFTALMDDFGNGYSSLNTLRNLEIDVIKLDAQFLWSGEDAGHKGVHILESVINMAKSLGLPIICEGVETEEQAAFLGGQGCRYVQGFKFFRPMNVDAFEKLIADEEVIDGQGLVPLLNEQFRTRELFDETVYSDAMLNSILGAVALYSWVGDDVNIIRFNEQFYETINTPYFNQLMNGIQKLMPADEAPKLFDLLRQAEERELTGAEGILDFNRADGSINKYYFHFFYLGETGESKRFYGKVRDVTQYALLQEQVRIMEKYASDTIVIVRKRGDRLHYTVPMNGLGGELGLSTKELEDELNSGAFDERLGGRTMAELRDYLSDPRTHAVPVRLDVQTAHGNRRGVIMKADYVDDPTSAIVRILDVRVE